MAQVRKSLAWELLLEGKPVQQVAAIVGVDDTMVRRYRSDMPDWWADQIKRKQKSAVKRRHARKVVHNERRI